MCSPIILCRIRYFDLANTGQPLLKCITVLLDFPHNIHIGDISWSSRWCFIEFTCSACSCVAHTIASVSFLRCPSFNYCHVLSVLTFSVYFKNLPKSGITEFRYPYIHISISLLYLRYLSKLCTSTFTHSSLLISPLSPSFLARCNIPTFPLRGRLPFMVINFLVLTSVIFNSSFVQSNTLAPYLVIPTTHTFTPAITFPAFNCTLSNFFTLLMYSLFTFSFISLFMMESNCNTSKYLYSPRLVPFIRFPSGNSTSSVRTIFPLFKTSTAHLFRSKTIPTPSEQIRTVWISEASCLSLFAYSFKSSINKR